MVLNPPALRVFRLSAIGKLALAVVLFSAVWPARAFAGTTGILEGTITDASTGKVVANATVTAVAASGTFKSTTDGKGFFAIQNVLPDSYLVSVSASGYVAISVPGVFVQQDAIVRFDQKLTGSLATIATVSAKARNNLVQGYQGSDVYNVSGDQLSASTGTDTHETVYQFLDTVPGVTGIGGGAFSQPSIRGGFDVDTGYEIDGIPITERQTGFFSTNLTNIGLSNVEVVTGGLDAANAGNGTGVINSVSKVGTYPGYVSVSTGLTDTEFNHYLRMELSGAQPNGKFNWYVAADAANSQNFYFDGTTATDTAIPVGYTPAYTGVGIQSGNPGSIYTRDVLANFHVRPNTRDDIQVLYLNSTFSDQANYGLFSSANDEATGNKPCAGATGNTPVTPSYGFGGVAPDGQPCPLGLYNYWLQSGTGNFLGHYSWLGKVEWDHAMGTKASLTLRLSELHNQYIFDQPYSDPNNPADNWYPQHFGPGVCPNYPYANGSPLLPSGSGVFAQCSEELGNYYQNRHESDYIGAAEYTWTPSENVSVKAGAGQEYDDQYQVQQYLNLFNYTAPSISGLSTCYGDNATYPCTAALSDTPSHVPYAYLQATLNVGRFTLDPSIRWSRIFYGVPAAAGGPVSAGFFAPGLSGTYRINPNNVIRYSYSTSGQFVGSSFVYQQNNVTWDPALNGAQAFEPSINHISDVQWEHQFGGGTSMRIGPYYRLTDNYPAAFTPFLGYVPGTFEWLPAPSVIQDNLRIRDFGAELGINHNDPRPTGIGWWLAASYNNYWTQLSDFAGAHASFINYPLAPYFLDKGIFVRGTYTPPLTASFVADFHSNGWHLVPNVYWTYGNYYNTGGCLPFNTTTNTFVKPGQNVVPVYCNSVSFTNAAGATKYLNPVLAPQSMGSGYWFANLGLYKDLGKRYRLGVDVQNLFDMQHATTPCFDYSGVGCFPYGTAGITGPANRYVYQQVSQQPRLIELYLTAKLPSGL